MSEGSENYDDDGGFDEEFGMEEKPVRDSKPSDSK